MRGWHGAQMCKKLISKRLHGESAENLFIRRSEKCSGCFYVILMETSIKSHLQNVCDCRSTVDGVTMGK